MTLGRAPDYWGLKAACPRHQASLQRMVWEVLDQFLLWKISHWLSEDEGSVQAPVLREKGQSPLIRIAFFPKHKY